MTTFLVLKKVVKSINHTTTLDFYVSTRTVLSGDALVAFFTFESKQDASLPTFDVKLTFELAVRVADLPSTFRVRNPMPLEERTPQVLRSVRATSRQIRESFERGERRLLLTATVTKGTTALPDISRLHKRPRQFIEYSIERSGTAFTTKSLPLSLSHVLAGNERANPRVWRISYDEVESLLAEKLTHFARFRNFRKALHVYDVISACGNRVVPKLNAATKRNVALWAFRNGCRGDSVYEAIVSVIEIVNGCVEAGNFCPSFCQAQVKLLLHQLVTS